MNKEQAEGKFDQLKAEIKQGWAKLTDDDIMLYKGKRDEFLGKVKEKYGIAKEEAEKKLKEYETNCGCSSDKAA